eukprot:6095385-Amphidinium_carterae.3
MVSQGMVGQNGARRAAGACCSTSFTSSIALKSAFLFANQWHVSLDSFDCVLETHCTSLLATQVMPSTSVATEIVAVEEIQCFFTCFHLNLGSEYRKYSGEVIAG